MSVTWSSQVQNGMQVVGSDAADIGRVKEVRSNDFLVDIPMRRDLYIPYGAVQNISQNQVIVPKNVDIYRHHIFCLIYTVIANRKG